MATFDSRVPNRCMSVYSSMAPDAMPHTRDIFATCAGVAQPHWETARDDVVVVVVVVVVIPSPRCAVYRPSSSMVLGSVDHMSWAWILV